MLQFLEERRRYPTSTILRAKCHQNAEVDDRSLRREAESLPKFLFEAFIGVELAVLRAAASSYQAVTDAIYLDPSQHLLNNGLLAGIQWLRWHIGCGHAYARIKSLQEAVG